MSKKFTILFFVIFIVFFTNAQLPKNIKFTNYTRANGLPEERVNDITQDSRGFLWMGTVEGLHRFDGQHYKSWYANPNDSATFSNNNILIIGEYRPGFILFSSANKLWELNITNHQLKIVEQFKNTQIVSTPVQLNETQWFFATYDSLFIISKNFKTEYAIALKNYYPNLSQVYLIKLNYPYAILQSPNANKFYLFNYVNKKITPISFDNTQAKKTNAFYINNYDSINNKLILHAYFDGAFYCELKIPEQTFYKPILILDINNGAIQKSILLPNSQLMFASANGLYISDYSKSILYKQNKINDNSLVNDAITNIYKSRNNDYWLSTNKGVSKFSLAQSTIQYWSNELKMPIEDDFKSIVKGNDGNLYFLNRELGLSQFNPTTKQIKKIDNKISYNWSLAKNGDEIIATGGGCKIIIYNTKNNTVSFQNYLNNYTTKDNQLITLVFKAKNGDVWFSGNAKTGIIRKFANTNKFETFTNTTSPPAFSLSYVHCAAEDSKGNIYFGTNKSDIILKWNAISNKFEELHDYELIPQNKIAAGITNLCIDKTDNLWIALGGAALLKYNVNSKTGNYYDINKGLPTNVVSSFCTDNKNRMWIGTKKGLSCYLPEKDNFVNFSSADGLPENNFEDGGIFYDKDENKIYIGAKKSVAFFNPDSLLVKSTTATPDIFIDEIIVNGKILFFEDAQKIMLQPDENNIEFNFAAIDFNRNNQLIFQYQLNGASKAWFDLGDKRSVTFNNLTSGKYTLSVRCKYKGTDVWNETQFPFTFTIKTPWNKSWWFYTLLAIATIGLALFINRQYYLRKIEKQKAIVAQQLAVQKERNRIAADMHDDLGSGLTKITYLSQMALQKDKQKEDLLKINKTSAELVENMSEIIWAMKEENNTLQDLMLYIKNYAMEYLEMNKINCQINMPEQFNSSIIKGENRRHIYLIVKELLHNIVKHAKAKNVYITANQNADWEIIIKDDGIGMQENNKKLLGGNGLKNIKKRIEKVNGTIKYENDNGTKVILHIPI